MTPFREGEMQEMMYDVVMTVLLLISTGLMVYAAATWPIYAVSWGLSAVRPPSRPSEGW